MEQKKYPEEKPIVGKFYLVEQFRHGFSIMKYSYEWDNDWRSVLVFYELPLSVNHK